MATITPKKGQTTATGTDSSTIRKTAQREYVQALQEALTRKEPNSPIGVFVVPVFDDKGKHNNVVVRDTVSNTLAMLMVMSVGNMVYFPEQRMYRQDIRSSLIFAPFDFLVNKYKAGTNIGGRIVTKYTVGSGNDRDIMKGIGTDIPCVNEDGELPKAQPQSSKKRKKPH